MSTHHVRKGKKDNGVPAHHPEIKRFATRMSFRTLKMMRRAIALLNSTPPSGTEDICKTPHQRVHFERAEMKCNQRRGQIKYLQHNKVGSCCQDIGDLHLFGVLKPER